jgi:long-chain acyl-CoA synthetase
MAGYWRRPADTEAILRMGFLHTGDAGYVDADGYLHIVDRLKDIIVSGGENVSSVEVESTLLSHPGVKDAAVIGVPHPHWGEAVKAFIVCLPDWAGQDDLIAHCRRHLGGFKLPQTVEVVTAIPRNGAGKILKNVLREPYWKGVARRVA